MPFLLSALPLVVLIFLLVKPRPIASWKALGIAAALTYGIRLLYFGSPEMILHAGMIQGLLTAWTPILVIWGAVFLFRTMEETGSMKTVRDWLSHVTSNQIAEVMIVGWAFSFLIEGASGFGTPVALAAPILVGLGFKPLPTIMACLVLNSVPVSFGAVGTPLWFGMGHLQLTQEELLRIGWHTALIHSIAGLVVPILALRILFPWTRIRRNLLFIWLSVLSCTIPYLGLSIVSVEFPALIGGALGLGGTILLAKYHIGLHSERDRSAKINASALLKALFPLLATIFLLLLTRVEFLPFKEWLSTHFVLSWQGILSTNLSWSHALLYVPSFLPFFVVSVLTLWLYRKNLQTFRNVTRQSAQRLFRPILTLSAALVLVKLFLVGDLAPALLIGRALAESTGTLWPFFAPLLGALGAFFSGSATISNLTFGGIQYAAATHAGLDPMLLLTLHNVGGAFGNMISISNIIAACAVLGIVNREGDILRQTIKPMLTYAVLTAVLAGIWLLF